MENKAYELYKKRIKKKKEIEDRTKKIIVTVAAVVFAFFFIMPTLLTVTNSFMAASEINANYGAIFATDKNGAKIFISKTVNLKFIPDMVSFAQYYTVLFKSPEYLFKFWNSMIYTVPIVGMQLALASLAAYGFSRHTSRIKDVIFFCYIVLMLMPYQVTLVPNYLVSDFLGILDTKWAIWFPGFFSPFAIYLLTKFMKRVPKELTEAAEIDGAGEWDIFSKIQLPLCKGGIASITILVFFDYWNMVEQPLILLKDPEKHPLSVFLSKINTGEISLAFAVAVIYLIPPLLLFLYGEDYLVEGISYQGGVKG
ncbi:carbohydrate ABC transporter permease [Butyrivibrio sp. LB2008]|uniref:carbohydrate ABC transporter permease n=1 Tax=Butyrivibrio sp. LB2008 TaxID=1408305 RepID=UPI0006889B86|nr:carbohydrate ABC transporter permease [Butyrivibrio sp. LB2008]